MAKQTRDLLKSYFQTGKKPTQQQFSDWLDSFLHKDDPLGNLVLSFATATQAISSNDSTHVMHPRAVYLAILHWAGQLAYSGLHSGLNSLVKIVALLRRHLGQCCKRHLGPRRTRKSPQLQRHLAEHRGLHLTRTAHHQWGRRATRGGAPRLQYSRRRLFEKPTGPICGCTQSDRQQRKSAHRNG